MSFVIDLRGTSPKGHVTSVPSVPSVWLTAWPLKWRIGLPIVAVDALAIAISIAILMLLLPGQALSMAGLLVLLAWPVVLLGVGAFAMTPGGVDVLPRGCVWRAALWVIVAVALFSLILPSQPIRAGLVLALLMAGTTVIGRSALAGWVREVHAREPYRVPILVRGSESEISDFLDLLERDPSQPFKVAAIQTLAGDPSRFGSLAIAAGDDPVAYATQANLSAVAFVGSQTEGSADLRRMIWRLEEAGIEAQMVPIVSTLSAPEVDRLGGTGVATLSFRGRDRRAETGLGKRLFDVVLASTALLLLAPLLAVTALAIRLTSPGPILFRQPRVGRDGELFTMLKFRTMVVDAEARLAEVAAMNKHSSGVLFKMEHDPRITSVGRFLRRYSIDELPQLVNVVRGEMSLVGPRPPLAREVELYQRDAHRRFRVRPGLTGLWQVSGRSDLSPEESERLDTFYVEHWSPQLDVWILARTVKTVLTADGAY